jgi:hypothetical protein
MVIILHALSYGTNKNRTKNRKKREKINGRREEEKVREQQE